MQTLRGGAYNNNQRNASCVYRYDFINDRNHYIGFRVARIN